MNASKQIKAVLIAVVAVASANAFAQGIPTMDGVGSSQRLVQIQNMIQQIQQMKSQLKAITGNANLGMILNNPALHAYLPDQWNEIYSSAANGSLRGLSSATTDILRANGLTNASTAGQQRVNNTLATNKAMASAAYDSSIQRLQNIQALLQQSNLTQSAADKADLQARIAGEQAMIQNESNRLNMMTALQTAETQLAARQQHIANKNALLGVDSNGTFNPNSTPGYSQANSISQ